MQKKILKLIGLSLFLFCANVAAKECAFINEIEDLVKLGPDRALTESRFGKPAPFLSVADGIGPSRPGIGKRDEAECVVDNYKFYMIWAGADVIICEGQFKSAKKAGYFAKNYNELLRRKLSSDKTYKCTAKHLAEERERRCSVTGQGLCTGLEDWSGAHSELTQFVWGLNSTSTTGYSPKEYGKYWVSIRDVEHREKILEEACDIFPKYGIKMDVKIYIELANFNRETEKWDKEELEFVRCSF